MPTYESIGELDVRIHNYFLPGITIHDIPAPINDGDIFIGPLGAIFIVAANDDNGVQFHRLIVDQRRTYHNDDDIVGSGDRADLARYDPDADADADAHRLATSSWSRHPSNFDPPATSYGNGLGPTHGTVADIRSRRRSIEDGQAVAE